MAHLAPQLYLSPGSAILAALARGHALPWGTHRTRGERARSQAECQSNRYHDEGAGERRLGRHQEDDAQQQGGYGLQRYQENGVVGALLKRLGQWTGWRLSCQPVDGPLAWLDERSEGYSLVKLGGWPMGLKWRPASRHCPCCWTNTSVMRNCPCMLLPR